MTICECKLDRSGRVRLEVRVESEGGGSSSSSGSVPLEFRLGVPPEQKVSLTIRGEGFRDVLYKDLVLQRGEGIRRLDIDLEPSMGAGVVILLISDDRGNWLDLANVRRVEGEYERALYAPSFVYLTSAPLHGENGRFEVAGLLRGEQTLRIDPIGGSWLVPALVEVSVPEIGEVILRVTLQRGGRLSLRLPPDHSVGRFGRVQLRVGDEWRGQSIELRRAGMTRYAPVQRLDPGVDHEVPIILPQGTYAVRLYLTGKRTIERESTIVPGQTTHLVLSDT